MFEMWSSVSFRGFMILESIYTNERYGLETTDQLHITDRESVSSETSSPWGVLGMGDGRGGRVGKADPLLDLLILWKAMSAASKWRL